MSKISKARRQEYYKLAKERKNKHLVASAMRMMEIYVKRAVYGGTLIESSQKTKAILYDWMIETMTEEAMEVLVKSKKISPKSTTEIIEDQAD